jgi:hypothetical protein
MQDRNKARRRVLIAALGLGALGLGAAGFRLDWWGLGVRRQADFFDHGNSAGRRQLQRQLWELFPAIGNRRERLRGCESLDRESMVQNEGRYFEPSHG